MSHNSTISYYLHSFAWLSSFHSHLVCATEPYDIVIQTFCLRSCQCEISVRKLLFIIHSTDSPDSYICFTAYPQSNSVGGVQNSSITNVIDCEALCVSIPACVAIDLDLSGTEYNGCWVHTLASDLNSLYNAQSVTQYRINRAC